jgi:hypothetical protein
LLLAIQLSQQTAAARAGCIETIGNWLIVPCFCQFELNQSAQRTFRQASRRKQRARECHGCGHDHGAPVPCHEGVGNDRSGELMLIRRQAGGKHRPRELAVLLFERRLNCRG